MKLAHATWQEVDALSRDVVVVVGTGSLEQHGPHLPLYTDSILATYVCESLEARLPDQVLLTPTLWLGASQHHLSFAGSLSATFDSYIGSLEALVESLLPHGFWKYLVVNGHGGNTEPNGIALRNLKQRHPTLLLAHCGYFDFCEEAAATTMEGRWKSIRHACEAETSMMLAVRPDLVRMDRAVDDGLEPVPPVRGLVATFDEITDHGVMGQATLASEAKGHAILEAAVVGLGRQVEAMAAGLRFQGP